MRGFALLVVYLAAALLTLWAVTALYLDLQHAFLKHLLVICYLLLIIFLLVRVSGNVRRFLVCAGGFTLVLLWWLMLKPSNDRPWQADVSETPWAEISGDKITIHNFRSCEYRAECEYECKWLTKTVDLSQLRGIDVAIT